VKPDSDPDALLKNAVFLELRRRYAHVGTAKAGRANFIVERISRFPAFLAARTVPEPVEL